MSWKWVVRGIACQGPAQGSRTRAYDTEDAEQRPPSRRSTLPDRHFASQTSFMFPPRSHPPPQVIEENKALLKSKYESAKGLGAAVNDSKGRINELRAAIETRRMQRSAAAVAAGRSPEELGEDAEEERCKGLMEQVGKQGVRSIVVMKPVWCLPYSMFWVRRGQVLNRVWCGTLGRCLSLGPTSRRLQSSTRDSGAICTWLRAERLRCVAANVIPLQEKARYKDSFNQLRELKKEIEHLHMLLEQSRTRLQRDFEQWMGLMLRQQQQQQQQGGAGAAGLPPSGPSPSRCARWACKGLGTGFRHGEPGEVVLILGCTFLHMGMLAQWCTLVSTHFP